MKVLIFMITLFLLPMCLPAAPIITDKVKLMLVDDLRESTPKPLKRWEHLTPYLKIAIQVNIENVKAIAINDENSMNKECTGMTHTSSHQTLWFDTPPQSKFIRLIINPPCMLGENNMASLSVNVMTHDKKYYKNTLTFESAYNLRNFDNLHHQ